MRRVVGPGCEGGAEAERRGVARSGEQDRQWARSRGLRGSDPGVRCLPTAEAVELPEAQADAGENDDDGDRGQHDRSETRWPHAQVPLFSWMVLPPSTTMSAPVT